MSASHHKKTYGIMQGRLSPPEDGRFQSFPRNSWRDEFARAAEVGLDYIEWIYDDYGAAENPLLSDAGSDELLALQDKHAIGIPAVCGDWFMDFPLVRCSAVELDVRQRFIDALLWACRRIGAHRLVIPFVDQSRIETEEESVLVGNVLKQSLCTAEQTGVEIHLEADFDPTVFAAFLSQIPHPMLKVNWDSGNSSGLGYIAHQEFAAYGDRIGSIHLKDRYRKPGGGIETRPLGEGSADFDDVFASMRAIGYTGGVTLQVARGKPGDEVAFIREQLSFVKARWQ